MACFRGALVVFLVVALPAASVRAQQPAAPAPYDAPDPWVTPVPGAAPPANGYGHAAAGAPTPMQLVAFDNQKKSVPLAVVLELFVFPGLGSIYGDHPAGAVIEWAGILGGIALVIVGANQVERTVFTPGGPRTTGNDTNAAVFIAAGCVAIVGGRVYGIVDSWRSTNAYNAGLARRLGLPPLAATVAPMSTDRGLAWGPTLQLRF
jgi:hypothetical protein